MTALIVPDDIAGRRRALEVLNAGGVVGLPTDTVYGVAVALGVPGGIERLFAAKRRPPDKGVVLLLDTAAQMAGVAIVTPAATVLTEACWPGGLTVVLAQVPGARLPDALTGGRLTIGLRLPDHPAPRWLAAALGPLPTSSANLSGQPEALDAQQVARQLGDGIDLILDGGALDGGVPSSVVDCSADPVRLLRPGAIAAAELGSLLQAAGLRLAADAPPDPAGRAFVGRWPPRASRGLMGREDRAARRAARSRKP